MLKRLMFAVLAISLAGGLLSCFGSQHPVPITVSTTTFTGSSPRTSGNLPFSFADIIDSVMPGVVFISTTSTSNDQSVIIEGSGVILSSNGYILTNKHVVAKAGEVEVVMQDRQRYVPTGIWKDDILDLAVIKIPGTNLAAVPFANSDLLKVGDLVLALGHPLGMSPDQGGATVTSGIIGNLGRSFSINNTPYYDVIQMDAPISEGSSGGPLVNMNGELVGINSAGTTGQIGYAINVATARHVYEDLVLYGHSQHPFLGVSLEDVIPEGPGSTLVGTKITGVEKNSPAYTVGLRTNDVIVEVDGQEITLTSELIRSLWRADVGDTVQLVYLRGSELMRARVELGDRPADIQSLSPEF